MAERRYSIDTSSLIAAWAERYPIDVFPTFWQRLGQLIESGLLAASIEVLRELKRKAPDLHDWIKDRAELFVEIDDECQQHVAALMAKYPKFVDERTGKSAGDPFVIAVAIGENKQLKVVTEEIGGTLDRPKIPNVCRLENIECINLLQLIRELGWKI